MDNKTSQDKIIETCDAVKEMLFFGKFFSQGMTFKYLLQTKIAVPREKV